MWLRILWICCFVVCCNVTWLTHDTRDWSITLKLSLILMQWLLILRADFRHWHIWHYIGCSLLIWPLYTPCRFPSLTHMTLHGLFASNLSITYSVQISVTDTYDITWVVFFWFDHYLLRADFPADNNSLYIKSSQPMPKLASKHVSTCHSKTFGIYTYIYIYIYIYIYVYIWYI